MKTEEFNLSEETLKRLGRYDITIATPIQKKIIPSIMKGRDVLAQSETGSGKTLSFAIPIIENTDPKDKIIALILVPTRELCTQITGEFVKFASRKIGISPVYGGVSIDNQIRKLKRSQIVVATPGRLLDIIQRRAIRLNDLKYFVLDEADRMLDMGFIADIEKIMEHIPAKRQTMLFSATITKEISGLIKKYLDDPVKVSLESTVKPEFLKQTYYRVTKKQKLSLLVGMLRKERDLALVFCNRKRITEDLAKELSHEGIKAACLNGDMSQAHRERVTRQFKEKRFSVLIATDVASRGLHIEDISHVYNYEIPRDVESYTHRIGRTARAGKKGEAISFVTGGDDERFFKQILFNYKGIITLKYADTKKEPKDKTYTEIRKQAEIKPERETKKRDERPRYEERKSDGERKDDRRKDDRRKDDRRKDDRRKDDRRKDDRRKDDRGSEGWRNDDVKYQRRGSAGRRKDGGKNDVRGRKEPGSVKQRRPDRESKEKIRQDIYFGKKETGRQKKGGGGLDFEKSLLEEINRLRELPFSSEEPFKKKSFRDYRTSTEEQDGKKQKGKSTYREEPYKQKKSWFDRFRRRKKR